MELISMYYLCISNNLSVLAVIPIHTTPSYPECYPQNFAMLQK